MDKLLFSFFKRFIIAPIVITVAVIICIGIVAPKAINNSMIPTVSVSQNVDISEYNLVEYKNFNTLKEADYVATISSDEIGLECAVCYSSSNNINAVNMLKQSKEPWNNGSVAIVGDNMGNKFKNLHNSNVGTSIVIDYYKNAVCSYNISKIVYNNTIKDIPKLMKEADLVLCVAYTDFESPNGTDKLYIAYLAELGGVDKWQ